MKLKHLALSAVVFAASQAAFAAVPDLSTLCATTANSCTSVTTTTGMATKDDKGNPITANAWQIQCTNDTAPSALLYEFTWTTTGADHYYILSPGGVASGTGMSYTSAGDAVSKYCTAPLKPGPNNTTIPRQPLSNWYPPKTTS